MKSEGLLFGTVEMLKPLLINAASEMGFRAFPENFSICGAMYQSYDICQVDATQAIQHLGVVETQQLPGERVLIIFDSQPHYVAPGKVTEAQSQLFGVFASGLIELLGNLGFIPLPLVEKPKRPMGFTPPAG